MGNVPGTQGYAQAIEAFAKASYRLQFERINQDFLSYLPVKPARILDVGAGVGQNSAALAKRGYQVVSVEPLLPFLSLARANFGNLNITWIEDSLPSLSTQLENLVLFDFILVDGVFHHLDETEQKESIAVFHQLLVVGGVCALSLRNGPPGVGTHVFPTNSNALARHAGKMGFEVVLYLENQPSQMKNKPSVTWDRLVLQK